MDWSKYYPAYIESKAKTEPSDARDVGAATAVNRLEKEVTVADIGCGFGGLLVALAPILPTSLILGLEIRTTVTTYVQDRIAALRSQHVDAATSYQNIACIRANTMKFLPNFFHKGQLEKIFLCFPDPHFKARKHKARIVSSTMNSEYAYAMREGGWMYTITDVEDLHLWMVKHFDAHESFERVPDGEVEKDPCAGAMREETEEGKKVTRVGGRKFVACWKRKKEPAWPGEENG